MATVVDFRMPDRRARTKPVAPRTSSTAEIVIFPGVRIERWTEGRPTPTPPHNRRKARSPALSD